MILEGDCRRAEALGGRIVGDALLDQALGPVADAAFRNAEDGLPALPALPELAEVPRPPTAKKVRIVPGCPAASP